MDDRPSVYEDNNGRLQRADARLEPVRATQAEEFAEAQDALAKNRAAQRGDADAPKAREWKSDGRKYGTLDEAWHHQGLKQELAASAADERAEIERDTQRRMHEHRKSEARNYSAQERAALTDIAQRAQAVETFDSVRSKALEYLRANPNDAKAHAQWAAFEQRAAELRRDLPQRLEAAKRLAQVKRLQHGRLELAEIDPELEKPENRARLVNYLVKQGFSKARAQSETDPTNIGIAWRAMRAEEDREHTESVRAEIAKHARGRNLNPLHTSYDDIEGARAALKSRGRLSDALELWTMQRHASQLNRSRRR